jgi:hypothetical protein
MRFGTEGPACTRRGRPRRASAPLVRRCSLGLGRDLGRLAATRSRSERRHEEQNDLQAPPDRLLASRERSWPTHQSPAKAPVQ